ncbi:hypothetical protein CISIN_1g047344mg, partial [Citrus sinensis]
FKHYITYGYPNLKNVRELIYMGGYTYFFLTFARRGN